MTDSSRASFLMTENDELVRGWDAWEEKRRIKSGAFPS